jgi:hypothetical protein
MEIRRQLRGAIETPVVVVELSRCRSTMSASSAYERSSVMVTTNLPFENWTEVLGSERLTGATLDRLTHRCKIIETKGESYRLQVAAKRSRTRTS